MSFRIWNLYEIIVKLYEKYVNRNAEKCRRRILAKRNKVTVQPGNELYSQNRENKKSFGATYPPKDFF